MTGGPAIDCRGLVKDFSVGLRGVRVRALDRLDLRVEAGEIYGLLGANGSGKSTALKLIVGLQTPTAGECRLFGRPSGATAARASLGYLPDAVEFPDYLTGRELVQFHAALAGVDRRERVTRTAAVLHETGMAAAADRRVRHYSRGMKQRLGLAQALVHDPELLVFDEPMAGLDPIAAAEWETLLLRLKAVGKTVLLTSHLLAGVTRICDRVGLLHRGRMLREGRVDALLDERDGGPRSLEEVFRECATSAAP